MDSSSHRIEVENSYLKFKCGSDVISNVVHSVDREVVSNRWNRLLLMYWDPLETEFQDQGGIACSFVTFLNGEFSSMVWTRPAASSSGYPAEANSGHFFPFPSEFVLFPSPDPFCEHSAHPVVDLQWLHVHLGTVSATTQRSQGQPLLRLVNKGNVLATHSNW